MDQAFSYNRILIDTNAFLFFINNDNQLSPVAKRLFESETELVFSTASLWEIAIKISIGKLKLPEPFEQFIPLHLDLNLIGIMPINIDDLKVVSNLEFHHKDPFDRIIIAQSINRGLPVATSDDAFDSYKIERIW